MSGEKLSSARTAAELDVFAGTNPRQVAKAFKASGMFPDLRDEAQAFVKIMAGRELGVGPMAAMSGLNVIKGRVVFSANLMASKVKSSGRYDYRLRDHSAEKCVIEFLQDGEAVGTSEFSMEDAKRAGLANGANWRNYPKAMLFARALSQGVRWYCPDVTAGSPAYVPEELGAAVDEEGEPVFVEAQVETETDVSPRLPDHTLDQLMKGFEIAGPELGGLSRLDGLNILLGSLGIDGFDAGTDIRAEMAARWTPAQAQAVDAELMALIDRAAVREAEEVDGEIVDPDAAASAEFEEQWEEASADADA